MSGDTRPANRPAGHPAGDLLVRRVPRLQEVVDTGFIDSADSGIRVGIRGQPSPLGFGIYVSHFLKKLHAIHFWHALVCEEESDAVAAKL
jgi:hypothetical protein